MSEENQKAFNPREHLMKLKSKEGEKEYLPVQWRLVWFREQCPQGTIETEMVHLDLTQAVTKEIPVWNNEKRRSDKVLKEAPGIALFRAKVSDGRGGVATGYGSESALDFGDFIEKAETKAIGRALAALGYGTQFAPELDEGARIVDAPVDRTPVAANGNGSNHANSSTGTARASGNSTPRDENAEATITEQQVASIRKLCQHLSKSEPDNVASISFLAAKGLIQQLTAEYKASRQPSPSPNANSQKPEPASAELLASARQMYQTLNREAPKDLDQKSPKVIRTLLEQMTGEYRDILNKNKGHAPTSQPTSTENAPDTKSLQKQCTKLGLKWETVVVTALKANIPDGNQTPEQQARIKQFLDNIEEQRLKNAIDQQKAS